MFEFRQSITDSRFIGVLYLDNRVLPRDKVQCEVEYELLRDR
jgi:hypothetical protein